VRQPSGVKPQRSDDRARTTIPSALGAVAARSVIAPTGNYAMRFLHWLRSGRVRCVWKRCTASIRTAAASNADMRTTWGVLDVFQAHRG
jgi:hypothetical protein